MEIAQNSGWWPVVRRGLVVAPIGSLESYFNQTSELPEFVHAPIKQAVQERLRNRLVRYDPELWKASPEAKIHAMADFDQGYLPREAAVRFTVGLVSSYVDSMRKRDLHDSRYRRYFYSFAEALQGRGPLPCRASSETLTGVSFILTGSMHLCRTIYIQRLRKLFGEPFRVESASLSDISVVWYFPVVVLQWPTCGTLKGLLEQFRDRFVSEIKDPAEKAPILRRVRGKNAASALIAASVLLNVGLIVIDGALAQGLRGELRDILAFLCSLQRHTGIPVLLSCSDAFLYGATKLGSEVETLLRGSKLAFEPLDRPSPDAKRPGSWHQHNQWIWNAGLLSPLLEMPRDLPSWTWEICRGRIDWLVDGFRALHERFAWEPKLLANGGPTRNLVEEAFNTSLRIQGEARTFIQQYGKPSSSLRREDYLQHIDYLPFSVFQNLLEVRQRRTLKGIEYA